jgi:hypothetical protein
MRTQGEMGWLAFPPPAQSFSRGGWYALPPLTLPFLWEGGGDSTKQITLESARHWLLEFIRKLAALETWSKELKCILIDWYKGEGLDPLQVGSRVNTADLANKSCKKIETLTDSAHARTVRAATTDSPDRGSSELRAGLSARLIWCSTGRTTMSWIVDGKYEHYGVVILFLFY